MTNQAQILAEIKVHAKKMRVAVDKTRAKCVDGGYREDEAVGAMAIAGAHLGVSMVLLSLGKTPQEAFDLVYNFVSKDGHPYCWHTDGHEGHGSIVGCGHCNLGITRGNLYELDGSLVEELLQIVRNATAEGNKKIECITLNREHTERAVLVVTSSDYTVKPWDETENIQYFIYDKTRHEDFLQAFSEFSGLNYDDLLSESGKQANTTLGLLGTSKGKPMIMVNVDADESVVEYLGNVAMVE